MAAMVKKTTHGGKRKGAGRKLGSGKGRSVVSKTVAMHSDSWDKLDRDRAITLLAISILCLSVAISFGVLIYRPSCPPASKPRESGLHFPSNPAVGDIYSHGEQKWKFDGAVWKISL